MQVPSPEQQPPGEQDKGKADDKEIDVLLELYKQAIMHGLHYQTQRSALTALIFTLCAATLGFTGLDKELNYFDLPLLFFLIALGIFGAVMVAIQHERYAWHAKQIDGYRQALDERLPTANIAEVKKCADKQTKAKYRLLFDLQIWWLWVLLHLLVAGLGIGLTWVILF
jgi:hypothetical protein